MENNLFIKVYQTGPLGVNTYLVCDPPTKECIIIDLGGSYCEIKQEIFDFGFNLKYLLNTHGHFDHIFGQKQAQEINKNLISFIHENDFDMAKNLDRELKKFGFNFSQQSADFTKFNETTQFKVGNKNIKVIHTPGHTKGSCSFLIDDNLFSGDTLFFNSIGRTDFEGSNFNEIINSIKNKLFNLDDNVKVYPGHDRMTNIGYEKANNPCI